jgi:hypothetical protein
MIQLEASSDTLKGLLVEPIGLPVMWEVMSRSIAA